MSNAIQLSDDLDDEQDDFAIIRQNAQQATPKPARMRDDLTEVGMVNRIYTKTEGDLKTIPERKIFMYWTGDRWEMDPYMSHATAAVVDGAEDILAEKKIIEANLPSMTAEQRKAAGKEIAALERAYERCRSRSVINNVIELMKRDARFIVPAADLDRDPWTLGTASGVVDLREGCTVYRNERDSYATKQVSANFYPDEDAPRWRQFIEEICGSPLPVERDAVTGEIIPETVGRYTRRPELEDYLQRLFGYCLTGSTAEQKMFIFQGGGSNGKNILLDTIQELLDSYCVTIPREALMAGKHDGDAERASPVTAMLAGARLAISSETKDGQKLDASLIKRHTGDAFMVARFLNENAFRFTITHKLILMTNVLPKLNELDEAIRGRLHIIPFDRTWNRPGHPERNPELPDGDKGLKVALSEERDGILAWMVEGAVAYCEDGLNPPAAVIAKTTNYFTGQDYLSQWLALCERCDASAGESAMNLIEAFDSWCRSEDAEDYTISQKAFSMRLQKAGVESKKTKTGKVYGLRPPVPG